MSAPSRHDFLTVLTRGRRLSELRRRDVTRTGIFTHRLNKKHLKNVGPIRHCEPPHAHSPDVATGTVARRLRMDVHDDNDGQRRRRRQRQRLTEGTAMAPWNGPDHDAASLHSWRHRRRESRRPNVSKSRRKIEPRVTQN